VSYTRFDLSFRSLLLSDLRTMPRPPTSTLFPYTTLFRSSTASMKRRRLSISSLALTSSSRCVRSSCVILLKVWPSWARSPSERRSEEHTSELQSRFDLVCRLLLEKKKQRNNRQQRTAVDA